ncbi:MAG: prepilin-type N-terminal cleavage/methylation domain-containing protein [Planctomycetes bacterium]|nr:prepilin-type N-terminal cleavage/methylation domain-containing protein [Planctomycetota bacterium]
MKVRNNSGFTFIEILVTIIILSIGFLGIVLLFPISFSANKALVEQTEASLVAESFKNSVDFAMNNATLNEQSGKYTVKLTHDIKTDSDNLVYIFELPSSVKDGWIHHPGRKASISDVEKLEAFGLNADPVIKNRSERIADEYDPVNLYAQFMISLDVRKVRPEGTVKKAGPGSVAVDEDEEDSLNFYEFRIHIFRKTAEEKKKIIITLSYAKAIR